MVERVKSEKNEKGNLRMANARWAEGNGWTVKDKPGQGQARLADWQGRAWQGRA